MPRIVRAALAAAWTLLVLGLGPGRASSQTIPSYVDPNPSAWKLVFADEFDGISLDLTRWEPSWFGGTGISRPVNSDEDGCYDARQVSVGDGRLTLRAVATSDTACRKRDGSRARYKSGLVNTRKSFSFSRGYFEARIFLPGSGGRPFNWPAWWSNGYGPWPATGEIDVMEVLSGRQPCWHYHYQDAQGAHRAPGRCVDIGDPTGWHVFGALRTSDRITFYYDRRPVGTITRGVVDSPHYLILNYGINDRYGIVVPSAMRVDYVRVWRRD